MNLKNIITQEFIEELLTNLNDIGIHKNNIECILVEGSSLYLENARDIDLKVIVKRTIDKAEIMRTFDIRGYKVQCCYYTFRSWKNVINNKKAYYIVESVDMVCIYGDDNSFYRFDILNDEIAKNHVIDVYDKHFFNVNENSKKKVYKLEEKRLWNFLLFAYKLQNNSHTITSEQLKTIQDAHDLKLDKEEFRPLFNQIKRSINNE